MRIDRYFLCFTALVTLALLVAAILNVVPYSIAQANQDILRKVIQSGDVEKLKELLAQGVSANEMIGTSPLLFLAAGSGKTELVRILVENGAVLEAKARWGRTALVEAAKGGHLDTVEFLLSKGADISAVDDQGSTPISNAVSYEQLEMVKLLLERGASANAIMHFGHPVPLLEGARKSGNEDIAKLLETRGAKGRTLEEIFGDKYFILSNLKTEQIADGLHVIAQYTRQTNNPAPEKPVAVVRIMCGTSVIDADFYFYTNLTDERVVIGRDRALSRTTSIIDRPAKCRIEEDEIELSFTSSYLDAVKPGIHGRRQIGLLIASEKNVRDDNIHTSAASNPVHTWVQFK